MGDVKEKRCTAARAVRFTIRRCDLPAAHEGRHVTNDGEGRPEFYWMER